jgi:hypothetical protein
MPRHTKKRERAALQKIRRKVRRRLRAHKRAKNGTARRKTATHPHRRASALRAKGS